MKKFVGFNLCCIVSLCLLIHVMTAFGLDRENQDYQYKEAIRESAQTQLTAGTGPVETQAAAGTEPMETQITAETEPGGKEEAPKNRWGIQPNPAEQDLIARITMLEAGGEPDRGQQAVVEVILNRVYSPLFPDTVYEVLSQEDNGCSQFVTWKNRNKDEATPTERVKRNVEAVLDGKTDILPFKTMYFSLKGENKQIQCTIGHHVFCNQP